MDRPDQRRAPTCATSSTSVATTRADDRAVLVGHDWGAHAGYGVVGADPGAFGRFVALAVPPVAALARRCSLTRQLKRSFYIWFIQQVGLAEAALVAARILGVAVGGLVAGLRRRATTSPNCAGT